MNKTSIIKRKVNKEHAERKRNQKKRNMSNESQKKNNRNIESANKRLVSYNFESSDSAKCFRYGKAHGKNDYLWNIDACFSCSHKGHKIAECPKE